MAIYMQQTCKPSERVIDSPTQQLEAVGKESQALLKMLKSNTVDKNNRPLKTMTEKFFRRELEKTDS
jgi:hypothetical protein